MEIEVSLLEKFILWGLEFIMSLFELLPDVALEGMDEIADAIELLVDFMGKANFLIPVRTILIVTSIVMGVRIVLTLIFVINWLVQAILSIIP